MRPSQLNHLFSPVSSLPGIGPRIASALAKLLRPGFSSRTEAIVLDLIFHLPTRYTDRRFICTVAQLPLSGIVTLKLQAERHVPPPPNKPGLPYRIVMSDDTGTVNLVYFKAFKDHMNRVLPVGETRFVSGEVSWFQSLPQINHPDHTLNEADYLRLPLIDPNYSLTEGVMPRLLKKQVQAALVALPDLGEWLPRHLIENHQWPTFGSALRDLHAPQAIAENLALTPSRQRLAFDELLASQLALALLRRSNRQTRRRPMRGNGSLRNQILSALSFRLTEYQITALDQILNDMGSSHRMVRLLQGDVGSGKTIVALLALAAAVESGSQGALMVPTEILARQHFVTIKNLVATTSLSIAFLSSRIKMQERHKLLKQLKNGEVDILIGTHALFQDDVAFKRLGLAVIDEQHRFGVQQRLALQAKAGIAADILAMTATPIPRTLALTAYGDMDVSKLSGKPPGRKPIETRVLSTDKLADVYAGLSRLISRGGLAFWVCPLIEESDALDMIAAEKRFEHLLKHFPGNVGLVHGRMKSTDRDAIIEKFRTAQLAILVATTVVEVGVDVPLATTIIIEDAQRFGLAQLHQLRGRVGRSDKQSSCVLLYREPLSETARARLAVMRETEDGFVIAEKDLQLRGAGEVLGTVQSGIPEYRIADLAHHQDLLVVARTEAETMIAQDPELASARGLDLRNLLYLFERDEAIKLLAAG